MTSRHRSRRAIAARLHRRRRLRLLRLLLVWRRRLPLRRIWMLRSHRSKEESDNGKNRI
jgi:hypothetical protein